ncbi:MAG: ribonuclease HII [Pseudomonadota bacterium]|nr:ribonuclease HII [Pseudomonadota bacterium]
MPDLSREISMGGRVAGIDEAGRGPWAGPVVAAAVVLHQSKMPDELRFGIRDSKVISSAKREHLFSLLHLCAEIGVGRAEVTEIDDTNILSATFMAMKRALQALSISVDIALVDGNQAPNLPCKVETLVKGDSLSLSIAAASIVAKVHRDREMAMLAKTFPGYGWEKNAGYGTKEHREALAKIGVTPHHRKTFSPVAKIISKF